MEGEAYGEIVSWPTVGRNLESQPVEGEETSRRRFTVSFPFPPSALSLSLPLRPRARGEGKGRKKGQGRAKAYERKWFFLFLFPSSSHPFLLLPYAFG